jgi:hypothetical protein
MKPLQKESIAAWTAGIGSPSFKAEKGMSFLLLKHPSPITALTQAAKVRKIGKATMIAVMSGVFEM